MSKSQKQINVEKQWLFFYTILCNRGKSSELSGKDLYGDINSLWFHHILPKSKYPDLRYCAENIIMLTPDEHNAVENGKVFEEIEKRKKDIQMRYDELVERTKEDLKDFIEPMYKHALTTNFFKQNQH